MPIYTYTTLDDPLATTSTIASGINDMGQIVGSYRNASGRHGFLYSGGVYTTLDDPQASANAGGTSAFGISKTGQIVGGYFDSSGLEHGFLYNGSSYSILDDSLGTNGTEPSGINASGQASCIAVAITPPSTTSWPSTAPLQPASTRQARSSGITLMPAITRTASSIPAVITTPPSTIP